MDLIDLEDDTIDAEVMDSLAVTMDNFRVRYIRVHVSLTVECMCKLLNTYVGIRQTFS